MARRPRIDHPGAWHHVMHRGARREPVFRTDEHCLMLLGSLDEAVAHFGLEVHAYSLMPNHYHLLVRTPLGNISRSMRHVNASYTQRVNLRHGWDGPLFRGRFHSQLLADEGHLDHVFVYIHLNPFQARLATRLDEPCWTSLRAYLGKEKAPRWLSTGYFLQRFGGGAGVEAAVRAQRKRKDRGLTELDEMGWIRAPDAATGPGSPERKRRDGSREARRLTVDEVLEMVRSVTGSSVAALRRAEMGPRANPARRLAVWALSRAQAYSHRDIAQALGMSEGQVAKVLWRLRRERAPAGFAAWMADIEAQVSSGRS